MKPAGCVSCSTNPPDDLYQFYWYEQTGHPGYAMVETNWYCHSCAQETSSSSLAELIAQGAHDQRLLDTHAADPERFVHIPTTTRQVRAATRRRR